MEKANAIRIASIPIAAGAEEPWTLPKGCRGFTLQVRDGTSIRIATRKGNALSSEAPYFTLLTDNSIDEEDLSIDVINSAVLFLASDSAVVVEVIYRVYDSTIGGGE